MPRQAKGQVVNWVLLALHVLAAVYQFLLFPIVLLPRDPLWSLTLLPFVLLSNPLWSLLHETVHGAFHRNARVNRLAGRVLAACYLAPWRVLRTGHLLHHRFNRTVLERDEVYDPAQTTWARAAVGYYWQLFGGLYVTQVLSLFAFLFPLPVLQRTALRFLAPDSYKARAAEILLRRAVIWELRTDALLIAVLLAVSSWAYGSQAWVLLAVLLARGLCISFLDYIYHYGSPLGANLHAYNLSLPRGLQRVLLSFNLHAVHHRHPSLPWHELPEAFAREGRAFADGYLAASLRQLRGPIPIDRLATAATAR